MVRSTLAGLVLLLATVPAAQETLFVESVNENSAAAAAGVVAGDLLLRLDGQEITSLEILRKVMKAHRPGDTVPLTVGREGEAVDLKLTFGERPDGRALHGLMLTINREVSANPAEPLGPGERGAARGECLVWIEKTYRIDPMMRELELDLSGEHEAVLGCVERNLRHVSPDLALKYCDNIFKVHCPGLDLLAEIAEAQVRRCEESLEQSLGFEVREHKAWKTCAQHKVFDRYVLKGESSDAAACRAAFVDECGAE